MAETLSSLANTPLPTILVIAGLVFVFVAIGGRLSGQFVTDNVKPRDALIAGALLMIVGIALNASGRSTPDSKAEPTVSGAAHDNDAKEAEPRDSTFSNKPGRIIFTRSLTANHQAAEDVKQITMGEKVFVFCSWFELTSGKEYAYHSEFFDGNGTLVYSSEWKNVPSQSTWYTWTPYTPKNNVDAPGLWTIRISFGEKRVEGRLIVTNK